MFYIIEDTEHKEVRLINTENQNGEKIYKEWPEKNLIVFGRIDEEPSNCEVIGKIIDKFNSIKELRSRGAYGIR